MALSKIERAEKLQARRESVARMNAAMEEARAVVATKTCPQCGRGIRHNWSIAGWWQCEQFGAVGFRKDANAAPRNWQVFTE